MVNKTNPNIDILSDTPITLTYSDFLSIMLSASNDAYNPQVKKRNANILHEPLSNYYIASSHSTYLAGDQVTGAASIDRYITVLEQNCRCIELQTWDGILDSEDPSMPVVSHGSSLSTTISFRGIDFPFISLADFNFSISF